MRRGFAIMGFVGVCWAVGCTSDASSDDAQDRTTNTRSESLSSESEQISFLERYAVLASPVIETEFHIVYRDNSTGRLPGPSDWDIKFAAEVEPDDIDVWFDGYTVDDGSAIELDEDLLEPWDLRSTPVTLSRAGSTRNIYRDEGVVVQHTTST